MQSERRTVSPLLYYILISSLTNLVFIVAGVTVLALFSLKLSNIAVQIIIFLLLWKGALVGFVTWIMYKKTWNKDLLVKFIGIYLGRFFGLFVGVFVGVYLGTRFSNMFKQAEIIGGIVGALAFYFAGRWIGSKVSVTIGGQLDKVLFLSELPEPEKMRGAKSIKRSILLAVTLYSIVLPLAFVTIGSLMIYFDIPVGNLAELLPVSRIVAIALSIFSVCSPWLMKNRWMVKYQAATASPEYVIYWLGLILSIVPAVYGFMLFIAMGASIVELCIFSAASSIAAIIWSSKNKIQIQPKAG